MKKILSFVIMSVLMLTLTCSCARKIFPAFNIKKESVTAIEFKQCTLNIDDIGNPLCVKKDVTAKEDIEKIIDWAQSLKLEKHEPIEYPIETVRYIIVLKGKLDHKITFLDDYVLFDSQAYTYKSDLQKKQVSEKYNFLNYTESKSTLGYTN